MFIWSSTCFGRHTAHHQEPKIALAASGISYVEGCWTCSWWMLSAWQTLMHTSNKNIQIFDIHISVHRNIITNYNQQDATFLEIIYFYRRSTGFMRFLRPSSGAHNCTYSFRRCQPILLLAVCTVMCSWWWTKEPSSISSTVAASSSIGWQYLKLYVKLYAPDDGLRNRVSSPPR
jgi:hypothetical protein